MVLGKKYPGTFAKGVSWLAEKLIIIEESGLGNQVGCADKIFYIEVNEYENGRSKRARAHTHTLFRFYRLEACLWQDLKGNSVIGVNNIYCWM